MNVQGKNYRTIWLKEGQEEVVSIIDQRQLPHQFVIEDLHTVHDVVQAIRDMHVRGAGLIGATAGYGMYLAALEARNNHSFDTCLNEAALQIKTARPTAVNPEWAVHRQQQAIAKGRSIEEKIVIAKQTAIQIAEEDAAYCAEIGRHGVALIEQIAKKKNGAPVHILTHCNAGWLAFVDHGSTLR